MVVAPHRPSELNRKCGFDQALDLSGFGRYNIAMLSSSCLLILAMYLDIFGFSVVLPAAACDLGLTTSQQGLLSAVPLIGVMLSSYAWGLCADTKGRRWTLLLAMPIGALLNLAASMAPTYASLAVLKFLSAGFTASANAAAFVLVGETTPRRHRSRFMFLMASATMLVQFFICVFAIPVFKLTFRFSISWLSMDYRPWRLLMQIISLPGIIGVVGMLFLYESPKFLLSRDRDGQALTVLKNMRTWNGGGVLELDTVYLEEPLQLVNSEASFLRKMWDQTAPLFKPPLLKNNLKLYYILLCAYMTMSSILLGAKLRTTTDCDNVIQPMTLYAVMCYSGASGIINVLLSFVVGPMGKKRTTLLVFVVSTTAGVVLLFVKISLLSISLFYVFLYVALILGNVNTYLVELNPTYLRGMATCLSVVVARGFGFFSVQLIAQLLTNHCTPMISGYVVLVSSGLATAFFLPSDVIKNNEDRVTV